MAETQGDLAARLGVSVATVSRALNGKPGVSNDIRRQILDAAAEQGYELPSSAAPTPAGLLIGIIVPELDNPVFPAFGQIISTMLVQHGHLPVLCSQSAPGISEDEWIQLLCERGLGGLIVISGMHADTLTSRGRYLTLRAKGIPLVLVNGHVDGLDVTSISVDDAGAMEFGVEHLVALGHRRIGLAVGPRRYMPVIRKVAGFTRALGRRAGSVDPQPFIESSMFSIEGGHAAASQLLASGVTAIICASDVMALGAIRAVRDLGLDVPRDVSIIGFDDSAFGTHTDPPLTTIRQPIAQMATAIVRSLLEEVRDGKHSRREYLFAPELVLRSSTSTASTTIRPR